MSDSALSRWRLTPAASWKLDTGKLVVSRDECLVFDCTGADVVLIGELFGRLVDAGGISATELRKSDAMQQIFTTLQRAGFIVSVEEPVEDETLARQMEWLSAHGMPVQSAYDSLVSANVALIGLGGIGANVLLQLAMVGVRSFTLIDRDVVEMGNLNRQPLYTISDCGKKKVNVAKRFIHERFPHIASTAIHTEISSIHSLHSISELQECSLLIACADQPLLDIEDAILEFSASTNIPVATASCGFSKGYWGPIVSGKEAATRLVDLQARRKEFQDRHGVLLGVPSATASVGPTNSAVASLLALDCLLFLAGSCASVPEKTIDFAIGASA